MTNSTEPAGTPDKSGISRRTVTTAMAWAVPAIAVAAPVPALAISGFIQFTGQGCKLPGNSNPVYKGYVFGLLVENTTAASYTIDIVSATLDGGDLGSIAAVNLSSGTCQGSVNPFTLPPNFTPAQKFAIVTQNAPNSQNGVLTVQYTVNSGPIQTVTVTVPAVPPINGASCLPTAFTDAEKQCIADALGATIPMWASGTTYALGDLVELSTGEYLVCGVGGMSGGTEPVGPFTPGVPIPDNEVTWYLSNI